MKRITDDTIVKVKVPKHLYESIMKRMALKENESGKIQVQAQFSDKEDQLSFENTWGLRPSSGNYVTANMPIDQVPELIEDFYDVYGLKVTLQAQPGENYGVQEKKEQVGKAHKSKHAGMKTGKPAVHKEGEQIEENLIDILANVDMQTLGMIASALGIAGGAAALAKMIKKEKGQPGGSTGAYL
jgi:hypothetical protein